MIGTGSLAITDALWARSQAETTAVRTYAGASGSLIEGTSGEPVTGSLVEIMRLAEAGPPREARSPGEA